MSLIEITYNRAGRQVQILRAHRAYQWHCDGCRQAPHYSDETTATLRAREHAATCKATP